MIWLIVLTWILTTAFYVKRSHRSTVLRSVENILELYMLDATKINVKDRDSLSTLNRSWTIWYLANVELFFIFKQKR